MQPCRATSASENSDLLSQITTQLSCNPLWLYKDYPLRVIKSYSPHMQNVHVGSNIIFVLFFLFPSTARRRPLRANHPSSCCEVRSLLRHFRFPKRRPVITSPSSPSVFFPPNHDVSPPLRYHIASLL
jgi:hypothetical protein